MAALSVATIPEAEPIGPRWLGESSHRNYAMCGMFTPDRRAIETPLVDGTERVGDRSCAA